MFLLLCLFISGTVIAQSGQNKFTVLGDAEAKYTATKGESGFGEINFKPIFLWKISDKLFVESEIEIETGDEVLLFEPDEERNWRSVIPFDSANESRKVQPELYQSIAEALDRIFRN